MLKKILNQNADCPLHLAHDIIKPMKIFRYLLVAAGLLCAGLGTIGVFLPGLPTTPFYLLAVFCFAKSSPRFHRWFINTRMYKKYLASYTKNRSLSLKTKISILMPVTVLLVISFILISMPVVKVLLVILLVIKYWYFIFKIKTAKPDPLEVVSLSNDDSTNVSSIQIKT